MKGIHAHLFLLLGVAMRLVPELWPGRFPSTGADGTNASELWLQVMGTVTTVIGSVYVVRQQVHPWLGRLATRLPRILEELQMPAHLLWPALPFEIQLHLVGDDEQRAAG